MQKKIKKIGDQSFDGWVQSLR